MAYFASCASFAWNFVFAEKSADMPHIHCCNMTGRSMLRNTTSSKAGVEEGRHAFSESLAHFRRLPPLKASKQRLISTKRPSPCDLGHHRTQPTELRGSVPSCPAFEKNSPWLHKASRSPVEWTLGSSKMVGKLAMLVPEL